jgi:hypothetical protein
MKQPYRNPDESEACAKSREEGFKDGVLKSKLMLSNWRYAFGSVLVLIPFIVCAGYSFGKAHGHEKTELKPACTDEAFNIYNNEHAACTHAGVASLVNGYVLQCLCPGESFVK